MTMESNEDAPATVIPVRKYHRYERGLETMERRYLASGRMERLVRKASERYHVQFRIPDFRPVFVSKRLKKYGGLFSGDKIVVARGHAESRWAGKDTLWHEIVHAFVNDNWDVYLRSNPNVTWKEYKPFERNIFRMAINDGSHKSYNWKLTCDCGYWWKSVKRRKEMFCPRCQTYVVSLTEFRKLKKVAAIGSKKFQIDISKYKPWTSNKKIVE